MTEHYSKQTVSVQRVTEEARSSFESNSMRVGYAMGDLERDANGKYVYLGMEASFDSYLMGWIARGKQGGAREHSLATALGKILKLVEDGILVRNADGDEDFACYMKQSMRMVEVLKEAQESFGPAAPTEGQ